MHHHRNVSTIWSYPKLSVFFTDYNIKLNKFKVKITVNIQSLIFNDYWKNKIKSQIIKMNFLNEQITAIE